MYADFYSEKNDILHIAKVSFIFHFSIIFALLLIVWLRPEKKPPPPIPFFEMVNLAPPPAAPVAKQQPKPKPPEPAPEQPPPEIKPELKPEVKPVKTPEPPKAKPDPKPAAPEPEQPSMDMPMDMPVDIAKKPDMDMPALRTVGSILMDPQIEAYLKTLHKLIYQNFNPPSGTAIAKGTKSSVQFQIARNGEISEVILRASSGNSIWDRLASRAVQITKPPPLPPTYDAEILPLIFDFREK